MKTLDEVVGGVVSDMVYVGMIDVNASENVKNVILPNLRDHLGGVLYEIMNHSFFDPKTGNDVVAISDVLDALEVLS